MEEKQQQKTPSAHLDHLDTIVTKNNSDYCSFSSQTTKQPSESSPVQQILQHATSLTPSDIDNDDDEERKKLSSAKKLLFPNAIATSFAEVEKTLRTERRQEFCPIYKDETAEEIALRQTKRKPVGSLLAKRIRWDDLRRKREEEELERRRQADMSARYGRYGPIYSNTNNQQQTFANPYEQYYTGVQNQYEQVDFSSKRKFHSRKPFSSDVTNASDSTRIQWFLA